MSDSYFLNRLISYTRELLTRFAFKIRTKMLNYHERYYINFFVPSFIFKVYCYTCLEGLRSPRLVNKEKYFSKLSRLNDNRCLQCFITRANLTTGLSLHAIIISFRCYYRQIRSPREKRAAMAASRFPFYQSRFYSMIVALSVFPTVAEGYRRHPFILATIR